MCIVEKADAYAWPYDCKKEITISISITFNFKIWNLVID